MVIMFLNISVSWSLFKSGFSKSNEKTRDTSLLLKCVGVISPVQHDVQMFSSFNN